MPGACQRRSRPDRAHGAASIAPEQLTYYLIRSRRTRKRKCRVSERPEVPPRLSTIGDRILERQHHPSRGRLWERYACDSRRSVGGHKYSWRMAPDDLIALAERQRVHALEALEGQVRSSRVLDVHACGPKATNG